MHRVLIPVLMVGLCSVGCDGDGAGVTADAVDFRLGAGNSQVLNSAVFNGVQFNGVQFNGSSFTGTLATAEGAVVKSGLAFEGAELRLLVNGAAVTLRFDDIYPDPAHPNGDVYFYQISVREDSVGTWTSLCKNFGGAATAAIPMANYWNYTTGARIDDPNVITFACRGGALAKCVEWGYVPWHTAVQCSSNNQDCATISLKDHHQACTRMTRADYCGDGRSYTFENTPIDIYDWLQTRIQVRSSLGHPEWSPEAEWGPNGATCVGDELRLQMFDDLGLTYNFPTCLDSLDDASNCGTMASTRPTSRLANSYCHEWTDDPAACNIAHNNDND